MPMFASTTPRGFHFLCLLFTLILLQGMIFTAPVQATSATVKVGDAYGAKVGSTVDVVISVQNPSGMAGFQFELTYNPNIAIVKSAAPGSSLPGSAPIVNMNNAASGSIRVAWMDLSPVHNNLDLCRITFEVRAAGETALELEKLELVGLDGSLASQAQNGTLSTQAGQDPAPKPDPDPDPKPDPEPAKLSIQTSQTLPHARKDSSYSTTLRASGGTKPYTWEIKSGNLPQGLELDESTGRISGTPEKTGRHDFTIKVSDKDHKNAEKKFSLSVSEGTSGPIYQPGFDFSEYITTDGLAFKNLTLSQGSMEVRLTPEGLPHTMVVGRNTADVDLLINLYDEDHKLYIDDTRHTANGAKKVTLQNGRNNITFRIVADENVSRLYTVTIFRIP